MTEPPTFDKIKFSDHQRANVAQEKPGHVYNEDDARAILGAPLATVSQPDGRIRFWGLLDGKPVATVVSATVSVSASVILSVGRVVTMFRKRKP